jgi:alanine racemase
MLGGNRETTMTMQQPHLDEPGTSSSSFQRVLRPSRAVPTDALRPTRAEVNLANLRHNLRVLRRVTGKTPLWAVLKADGYGHGAKAVARTLERAGTDGICVALIEEGIELREAGIRAPILVMGGYYRRAWGEVIAHELTPVVHDAGQIASLADEIRFHGGSAVKVHVKVDTGMARLGASLAELDEIGRALTDHPEVQLEGLMTHFACADAEDQTSVREQMTRFEEATRHLRKLGFAPLLRHAANSAALLGNPDAHYDFVRPGVSLFGVHPLGAGRVVRSQPRPALESSPDFSEAEAPTSNGELRPVMSVLSQIVALRDVAVGDTVGYGATWKAERPSRIATIPIGYADGVSRSLSNRGFALVRGKRAPIVGVISMDMLMLDVTDVPGANVSDEAVLLGTQRGALGTDEITATEIAQQTGTIAWEVLTNISRRVPRFYREP